MARKTKQVEIDGLKYRIRQIGGMDGLRLKAMAVQTLGESAATFFVRGGLSMLAGLLKTDEDGKVSLDFDIGPEEAKTITAAVASLAASATPEKVVRMMAFMAYGQVSFQTKSEVAGKTEIQWIDIDDDLAFENAVDRSENPLHSTMLFGHCLSVNLFPISAAANTTGPEQSAAASQ